MTIMMNTRHVLDAESLTNTHHTLYNVESIIMTSTVNTHLETEAACLFNVTSMILTSLMNKHHVLDEKHL